MRRAGKRDGRRENMYPYYLKIGVGSRSSSPPSSASVGSTSGPGTNSPDPVAEHNDD